jgi:hypothetical protein
MPDAMDVDAEAPNSMPGAFEMPRANGANGTHVDDDAGEGAPEPPPHKSNPASPVQDAPPTPEQAEAFKTLGNKYYKAKEYKKAIEEYTKGIWQNPRAEASANLFPLKPSKRNRLPPRTSAIVRPHTYPLGCTLMPLTTAPELTS